MNYEVIQIIKQLLKIKFFINKNISKSVPGIIALQFIQNLTMDLSILTHYRATNV